MLMPFRYAVGLDLSLFPAYYPVSMQGLSERTRGFTDSVIRRMTRVCMRYDAVNLSQGFPDFDPPREILDQLAELARHGPHQYSITWGAQNFREALAEKNDEIILSMDLQSGPKSINIIA
jgi:hypothetical protein